MTGTDTVDVRPSVTRARESRTGGVLVALFAVYLVLLVWLVLWKFDIPYTDATARVVKLVPFVSRLPQFGPSQPAEVVANLLIFVPFGVYLGLIARSWRWWKSVAVMAAASAGLEIVEYVLAVGSTDVTDVIVNTAGGVAGLVLVAALRRLLGERITVVMTRVLAILTLLAVLAVALFIASPLHYGPPRDRGGLPPLPNSQRG
jgi:glycopeptide antibiotics resistance protein